MNQFLAFVCNIHWEALSAIGTILGSLLVFWTVLEMRRQRIATYRAQLCLPSNDFFIERTKKGFPTIFKRELKLIEQKMNNNYTTRIEVDLLNVGFGAAIDVGIDFDINLSRLRKLLDERIVLGENFVKLKSKDKNIFAYRMTLDSDSMDFFIQEFKSKENRLSVLESQSKSSILLPDIIKDAINALIINSSQEGQRIESQALLPITTKIQYKDVAGDIVEKTYTRLEVSWSSTNIRQKRNFAHGILKFEI